MRNGWECKSARENQHRYGRSSGLTPCASVAPHLSIGMTVEPKSVFKMATILGLRSGVNCNRPSRRAVTPHQRNPFAPQPHPLLSYHCDQQFRPSRALEHSSPYCNLVPTHPRLFHWWQSVLLGLADPDHQALQLRCGGWSLEFHLVCIGGLHVSTWPHTCHASD
jgi:hypothetical protein